MLRRLIPPPTPGHELLELGAQMPPPPRATGGRRLARLGGGGGTMGQVCFTAISSNHTCPSVLVQWSRSLFSVLAVGGGGAPEAIPHQSTTNSLTRCLHSLLLAQAPHPVPAHPWSRQRADTLWLEQGCPNQDPPPLAAAAPPSPESLRSKPHPRPDLASRKDPVLQIVPFPRPWQ